ncbi:MAG TPA: hypothetical protein DIU15_07285, partial [Deltaproteobacteria bacterium]|nr:hypothetical protein [Deltaproteobacteria bacterium]
LQIKENAPRADEVEPLLEQVERWVETQSIRNYIRARDEQGSPHGAAIAARRLELVLSRIKALAHEHNIPLDDSQQQRAGAILSQTRSKADAASISEGLERFLGSSECLVELPNDERGLVQRVATRLAELGPEPDESAILRTLESALEPGGLEPIELEDLAFSVTTPLRELWIQEKALALATTVIEEAELRIPSGPGGDRFVQRLATAAIDLGNEEALISAPTTGHRDEPGSSGDGTLHLRVNGLPVLHRGLSHSVTQNQFRSLGFALSLVLVLMIGFFRSVTAGCLATAPTAATLLVVFGGMGALDVHLDIGTSMLASIIIGAGVDYGVHLLAGWRSEHPSTGEPVSRGSLESAARNAAMNTAPAIWTNATMVAAGFFVLTLGEAKPLQNVGSLTATAMLIAAAATFIVVPVLARRDRYTGEYAIPRPEGDPKLE